MKALLAVLLLAALPALAREPTQHDKLDLILKQLAEVKALLTGKPPAAVVVPVPPKPSADPRYAPYAGLTPQEIQTPFGPFQGQGLPTWWDWEAAYAAGVKRPGPVAPPTGGGTIVAGGSVIPWNASAGDGAYLRVQGAVANLQIVPPAGYCGTRQYIIAPVPPTAQSAMTVTVAGTPPQQFGQYGQGWTGRICTTTTVTISLFDAHQPVDGAYTIQLVGPQ